MMLSLPFLKDLYEDFFKSTIRLGVKDIFSLEKVIEGMSKRKNKSIKTLYSNDELIESL